MAGPLYKGNSPSILFQARKGKNGSEVQLEFNEGAVHIFEDRTCELDACAFDLVISNLALARGPPFTPPSHHMGLALKNHSTSATWINQFSKLPKLVCHLISHV